MNINNISAAKAKNTNIYFHSPRSYRIFLNSAQPCNAKDARTCFAKFTEIKTS